MRQKISQWPAVYVRVDPEVYARIEAQAEAQTLPTSAIIRAALNRAFKEQPSGVLSPPKGA